MLTPVRDDSWRGTDASRQGVAFVETLFAVPPPVGERSPCEPISFCLVEDTDVLWPQPWDPTGVAPLLRRRRRHANGWLVCLPMQQVVLTPEEDRVAMIVPVGQHRRTPRLLEESALHLGRHRVMLIEALRRVPAGAVVRTPLEPIPVTAVEQAKAVDAYRTSIELSTRQRPRSLPASRLRTSAEIVDRDEVRVPHQRTIGSTHDEGAPQRRITESPVTHRRW